MSVEYKERTCWLVDNLGIGKCGSCKIEMTKGSVFHAPENGECSDPDCDAFVDWVHRDVEDPEVVIVNICLQCFKSKNDVLSSYPLTVFGTTRDTRRLRVIKSLPTSRNSKNANKIN